MRKRLTGLIVGVAAAALVVITGLPGAAPGTAAAAVATPLGQYPCQGYSGVDVINPVDQVMRDVLVVTGFAPYRIGVGANISWTLDPYHHASWRLWLHSLRWEGSLLRAYQSTHNAVYLDRAVLIAKDWIHDNPMTRLAPIAIEAQAHRTQVLLCLHAIIGNQPWLVAALDAHAALITHHFSGINNHGLDESLALLGIGCRLGRRTYASLAATRIGQVVPGLVDANGVNTEQSVGYQAYDYRRLLAAQTLLQACGYAPPAVLASRVARMPLFIAHSTMPDGTAAQLGDTEARRIAVFRGTAAEYPATLGTSGTVPSTALTAIYPAGYAFGRDSWKPSAGSSFYSLRFGPPRTGHGHNDHTSMTWFARGRLLLTEAGHIGYEASARRAHVLSPAGHNVLTVAGVAPGNPSTRLIASSVRPGRAFYEFSDTAYGAARRRSVLVLNHPNVIVVYDQMSSATVRGYRQLWHLPADMSVSILSRGTAAALPTQGDVRLQLTQVPLPGQTLPAGGTTVVRGRTTPSLLGWLAPVVMRWLAAPVVSMNRAGAGTRIVTVLAAGPRNGPVAVSRARLGSDGWWHVGVNVAGATAVVRISSGGALSLG